MKEIGSKVLLGQAAVMVSCDSGGGSGEEPNQVVTPPRTFLKRLTRTRLVPRLQELK